MTQETPEKPTTFRRCANCGAELRPNDRFCGECGLPVYVTPGQEATPAERPPEASPATPPVTPTISTAPATPTVSTPPPAPPKKGDGTWAVIVGVVLLLIGLASCVLGAIAMAFMPQIETDPDIVSTMQAASGFCCILPALLLAIAGGVVWYVWGRKKS